MPVELSMFPPTCRPRLGLSPYDRFMDGRVWRLDASDYRDVDGREVVRRALYRRAKRLGTRVKVRLVPDGLVVQRIATFAADRGEDT